MNNLYNSYQSLVDWLAAGKNKLDRPAPESNGKTTRIVADADLDWVGVKLHRTIVVKFYKDGRVQFNSDGWQTVTTRDRMNCYAPSTKWNQETKKYDDGLRIHVNTENRIMYLVTFIGSGSMWNDPDAKKYLYEDNMIVYPNGRVTNQDGDLINPNNKNKEKSKRKKLDKVKKYSNEFIKRFINQEIDNPGPGDCWYCLSHISNSPIPPIQTIHADGQLTDGFDETGHIQSHIEESYFVPSLLYNAIESQRTRLAPIDNHNIAWCTKSSGWEKHKPWSIDLTERRLKMVLTRYLCKQLGYAVS